MGNFILMQSNYSDRGLFAVAFDKLPAKLARKLFYTGYATHNYVHPSPLAPLLARRCRRRICPPL